MRKIKFLRKLLSLLLLSFSCDLDLLENPLTFEEDSSEGLSLGLIADLIDAPVIVNLLDINSNQFITSDVVVDVIYVSDGRDIYGPSGVAIRKVNISEGSFSFGLDENENGFPLPVEVQLKISSPNNTYATTYETIRIYNLAIPQVETVYLVSKKTDQGIGIEVDQRMEFNLVANGVANDDIPFGISNPEGNTRIEVVIPKGTSFLDVNQELISSSGLLELEIVFSNESILSQYDIFPGGLVVTNGDRIAGEDITETNPAYFVSFGFMDIEVTLGDTEVAFFGNEEPEVTIEIIDENLSDVDKFGQRGSLWSLDDDIAPLKWVEERNDLSFQSTSTGFITTFTIDHLSIWSLNSPDPFGVCPSPTIIRLNNPSGVDRSHFAVSRNVIYQQIQSEVFVVSETGTDFEIRYLPELDDDNGIEFKLYDANFQVEDLSQNPIIAIPDLTCSGETFDLPELPDCVSAQVVYICRKSELYLGNIGLQIGDNDTSPILWEEYGYFLPDDSGSSVLLDIPITNNFPEAFQMKVIFGNKVVTIEDEDNFFRELLLSTGAGIQMGSFDTINIVEQTPTGSNVQTIQYKLNTGLSDDPNNTSRCAVQMKLEFTGNENSLGQEFCG